MKRPEFQSTSAGLALVSRKAVEGDLYELAVPDMSSACCVTLSVMGSKSISGLSQLTTDITVTTIVPEDSYAVPGFDRGTSEYWEEGSCLLWKLPEADKA